MNIALIGYGKMGQMVKMLTEERGHKIVSIIDIDNASDIGLLKDSGADVAIEFTGPDTAFDNVYSCINSGIPVVSGSTGWLDRWEEISQFCNVKDGTLFYASNFSLGVNLFFRLNKQLASLMSGYPQYKASMTEIHHIHKKDSPSGTAITLAEGLTEQHSEYSGWSENPESIEDMLIINSVREGEVPGTHIINYISDEDSIEIKHEAFGRKGFAMGAVLVAEWILDKKGILSMDDFLDR
jgi:4-hydroxy-tetrahydrodipicolinate reductase